MQYKTKIIYALLPLLMLLFASCGSDDDEQEKEKPIPTHRETLKFDNGGGTGVMKLNEAYEHFNICAVITKIGEAKEENVYTYNYSGSGETFEFSVETGWCRLVKSQGCDVVTVEVDRNNTGLSRIAVVDFSIFPGVGPATILGIYQTP